MTQSNQLVVVTTREELLLLITEVLEKFLKSDLSPYPSRISGGVATKVFTRDEVAEILKCSPNTVTKYIKQKKLHASVFNRQYRININELEKFVNQKSKC